MFIRVYREQEQKEILFNTNSIWKIEVTYAVPGPPESDRLYATSLERGATDPGAVRVYRVFVGSEEILLLSTDPDDPALKVLNDIYKDAVKGPSAPPPEEG